jgi:S1-C subfamily serine protease
VLKLITMIMLLLSPMAMAAEYTPAIPIDHIESSASSAEKNVRQSAVRVTVPFTGGHGSGSYIRHKDVHLVITAQHVVSGPLGTSYLVSHKEESHIGILIYSDEANDIGILYIRTPFRRIEPLKFNPIEETAAVGTEIVYSGYPSHHKLMSFRGRVAGHEPNGTPLPGKHIILQTYGWFGCSGAIVYDTKGHQIGVLYGVDIEYYPNIQVQENMIWVVPINELKIDKALGAFCRGYQGKVPKACK